MNFTHKTSTGSGFLASLNQRQISRRQLVIRGATLGLGTVTASTLLAACEADDDGVEPVDDTDDTVDPAATDDDDVTDDDLEELAEAELDGDYLAAPEPDPKYGGTLRIGSGNHPAQFDIDQSATLANIWQQGTMYDNLVRFNPLDGGRSIIPDLAMSWEVADDGLSYTFDLREGVQFHDGSDFTSEDVKATFSRRMNPPEGVSSIRRHLFAAVDEIVAVDDFTVRFELTSPAAFFIEAIATGWSVIFSAGSIEEHDGDFRRVFDVPGTGPYRLLEHQQDEAIIVEKNDDYWNPNLPYLDRIERIVIPDQGDQGTAALTGEVDLADSVTVEAVRDAQERPGVDSLFHVATWIDAVTFNTQRAPFDDPRVRRAVHLAISRQQLASVTERVRNVQVGTRWCHPSVPEATPEDEVLALPGFRADKDEDIAEAQRLMEDAGYGDGFDGLVFLLRDPGWRTEIFAPAFQDLILEHLNLDCSIEMVESAIYFDLVADGDFDMTFGSPAAAIHDPSDAWGQWFVTGGEQNFGQFSNEEFDELVEQINVEFDLERRRDLVRQAEDLLDQECPMYFFGWINIGRLWSEDLRGIEHDFQGSYSLYRYDTLWLDR